MEKLIVFIIILIFSGIGKLIQKHNEQKQLEALRRVQRDPAQQRRQSELEAFLGGRKSEPEVEVEVIEESDYRSTTAPREPAPTRRDPVRPVPAQVAPVRPGVQPQGNRGQQSNRSQQGNQNRQQPQPQQQKKQKKPKSGQQNRPAQPQPQQNPQRRPLGDSVRSHVEQHIRHLDTDVDDYVKSDIVDSVNSHLGVFSGGEAGGDTDGRTGNPTAARLISALRSPDGVRQAMLINEILSRPRALRK